MERSQLDNSKRVFAAIDDDELQDAVVEEAVRIAIKEKAHVRFGHIAKKPGEDFEGDLTSYLQAVSDRIHVAIADKLAQMGATDEVLDGDVVVQTMRSEAEATIDQPCCYPIDQLVESMAKPYEPDVVVCGSATKSKLRTLLHGNASEYIARNLDCEVVRVISA